MYGLEASSESSSCVGGVGSGRLGALRVGDPMSGVSSSFEAISNTWALT